MNRPEAGPISSRRDLLVYHISTALTGTGLAALGLEVYNYIIERNRVLEVKDTTHLILHNNCEKFATPDYMDQCKKDAKQLVTDSYSDIESAAVKVAAVRGSTLSAFAIVGIGIKVTDTWWQRRLTRRFRRR